MADGGSFGTQLWETPVGLVVKGMDTVAKFYSGYGDMPPWGKGPTQQDIRSQGISYIQENFPLIDSFLECKVKRSSGGTSSGASPDRNLKREEKQNVKDTHNSHKEHAQEQKRHHDPAGQAHGHTNIRVPPVDSYRPHQSREQRKETLAKVPPVHHHPNHHHNQAAAAAAAAGDEPAQLQQQRVAGELHHQHSVHFNAAPNEEGLTKLSWELVGSCLLLFLAVILLWLRIVLRVPATKSRKTS
jgi:hypothetical protein